VVLSSVAIEAAMEATVVTFDDHPTRAHVAAPAAVQAIIVMTLDYNRLCVGGTSRRSETKNCQACRRKSQITHGSFSLSVDFQPCVDNRFAKKPFHE
jgi:hypothetical protein